MQDSTLTAADEARHDLVALAVSIDVARDADTAWTSYDVARRRYYGAPESVQDDDGVRFAWQQVLAVYGIKLDEFASPIEPLVVLG